MAFRIKHLEHDFLLSRGRFLIGRSLECQLALDDPLVSRQHAAIEIRATDQAVLVDLGSRNGVSLNGKRVTGEHPLHDGDVINIGDQVLTLLSVADDRRSLADSTHITTGAFDAQEIQAASEPTSHGHVMFNPAATGSVNERLKNSFRHLGPVADKSLALGRKEEAERILGTLFAQLEREADRSVLDGELLESAFRFAIKLSVQCGRPEWLEYMFGMAAHQQWILSGAVVDDLHGAFRKVRPVSLETLRGYLDSVDGPTVRHTAAERFLVKRVHGLVAMAATR